MGLFVETIARHLNSRRRQVTIPGEDCKMRLDFPRGEEAPSRGVWNHEPTLAPHPSRRGKVPLLRMRETNGGRRDERSSNIEPSGFDRRSVFARVPARSLSAS